jgi:mono/diheme cytochrome c family protein
VRFLVLVGVLLAGTARADAPGPSFGNRFAFTEQGGAAIYAGVCAACHMADGRGAAGAGRYPALIQNPNLATAAYPIDRVLHGSKAMPPFGRLLTDAQIADVVGYIRTHFGNDYAEPVAAADVAGMR